VREHEFWQIKRGVVFHPKRIDYLANSVSL